MKVYEINNDSYAFSMNQRLYYHSMTKAFSIRLTESESWSMDGVSESWFFAEEDIGCKVFK